jgi:2'-5' RNA ligase
MSQGSLPGFEPAAPTDRLFLAIFPCQEDAAKLAAIAKRHLARQQPPAQPLRTDRLHVTLFHLGDYSGLPPSLAQNAAAALSCLAGQVFTVQFDQIGSFGSRQAKCPWVLASRSLIEPLHALHQQLAAQLRAFSLGSWTHGSYVPHMTVAYGKANMPLQSIEPVAWTAGEVVLVHSLLGKTQHIPLLRKRLA